MLLLGMVVVDCRDGGGGIRRVVLVGAADSHASACCGGAAVFCNAFNAFCLPFNKSSNDKFCCWRISLKLNPPDCLSKFFISTARFPAFASLCFASTSSFLATEYGRR